VLPSVQRYSEGKAISGIHDGIPASYQLTGATGPNDGGASHFSSAGIRHSVE
jgi:hypothetical protein